MTKRYQFRNGAVELSTFVFKLKTNKKSWIECRDWLLWRSATSLICPDLPSIG